MPSARPWSVPRDHYRGPCPRAGRPSESRQPRNQVLGARLAWLCPMRSTSPATLRESCPLAPPFS
eukprot:3288028-Pyramimonas_sp.AAC.1